MFARTLVLAKPATVPEWIGKFADRTKGLGYDLLAKRVAESTAYCAVVAVLAEVGVGVYSPESVRSYKAKMVTWKKIAPRLRISVISLMVCFLMAGISAFLGYGYDAWFPAKGTGFARFLTAVFAWLIGAAALVPAGFSIWAMFSDDFMYRVRWDRKPLQNYHEPIPANVLDAAVKVRERYPSSTLHVDELESEKIEKVRDPFLVAHIDGNEYYIGVWKEPSFKGITI